MRIISPNLISFFKKNEDEVSKLLGNKRFIGYYTCYRFSDGEGNFHKFYALDFVNWKHNKEYYNSALYIAMNEEADVAND